MSWSAPWLLTALLALPLLWWLMRLLPPAPRVVAFPAVALLTEQPRTTAQQRLPWWLLAVRLLIAALLILGLAGPHWQAANTARPATHQTLIIDTGWLAAHRFAEVRALALKAIQDTQTPQTLYRLLQTADTDADLQRSAQEWLSPGLTREKIQRLDPQPWAGDRRRVTRLAAQGDSLFISDGLEPDSSAALLKWARRAGRVHVYEATRLPPVQIRRAQMVPAGLAVDLAQAPESTARTLSLAAQAADGTTISLVPLKMKQGQISARVLLPLPPGARVRVALLRILGEASAGAVHLLDRRRARLYVGISSRDADSPLSLRTPDFYLQRALETHADVTRGDIDPLLARNVNLILLPDALPEDPAVQHRLQMWVSKGGILLMFAGPRTNRLTSPLLPLRLRPQARSFGGALSWGKPAKMGPWPAGSPFAGLALPADVTVRQQWLAEPGFETTAQTWAQLSDSTPLVSAAARGAGLVVLFHTTANADWSNLVLSGVFEQMLMRLLPFAADMASPKINPSAPYRLSTQLTGIGTLDPATRTIVTTRSQLEGTKEASAQLPPGLYTAAGAAMPLNAGGRIPGWIANYADADLRTGSKPRRFAFDARPWLLGLAALLLLLDALLTLALKGLFRRPRFPALALLSGLSVAAPGAAIAQGIPEGAFDVRLCAVRGFAETDSLAGLQNLTQAVRMRTAIVAGEPRLVRIQDSSIGLCTLLYWPIGPSTPVLDGASAARLQHYMMQGGQLMIDSGWRVADPAGLQRQLAALQLPRLVQLDSRHVLARSFYLLERAPGGFEFPVVWVETGTSGANGRTSQILLTQSRWSAQWGANLSPQLQERALRFGVNAVIYALTGTYKSDQVHAAGLLERMARPPK